MQKKIYPTLFSTSFILSSFTFGGGYVIISLLQKKYVDELKWIDETEMLNMITIAQSSPGVVAVNISILIGYKLGGFLGAIVCTLGTIIPPLITITIISFFYNFLKDNIYFNSLLKGMQIGVLIIIANVVTSMIKSLIKTKNILYFIMLICDFIMATFFNINILIIILISIFIGIIDTFLKLKHIS